MFASDWVGLDCVAYTAHVVRLGAGSSCSKLHHYLWLAVTGGTHTIQPFKALLFNSKRYLTHSCNHLSLRLDPLLQQSGFTVVAEKLNFFRYLSHFRAVHRGAFFSQMRTTSVRKLLPEAWGGCGLFDHVMSADNHVTSLENHVSASPEGCVISLERHVTASDDHVTQPVNHVMSHESHMTLCVTCRLPVSGAHA